MLTQEQVAGYREHGYLAPIEGLTATEVAGHRRRFQEFLDSTPWPLDRRLQHKPHLYLRWASDIALHPKVVDTVEDLLGPNLLIWRSAFFIKQPYDTAFTAWHQDAQYWGLNSDEVVTAWVALTDSTIENGCLRVVAGSHRWGNVPHKLKRDGDNVLLRGQVAAVDIPSDAVCCLELKAGQFSLHHVNILHGSEPNRSGSLRAGLAIRFISSNVRHLGGRQSATIVRGVYQFGHFDPEPVPTHDYDPIAMRAHARSVRRYALEVIREAVTAPTWMRFFMLCRIVLHRKTWSVLRTRLGRVTKNR